MPQVHGELDSLAALYHCLRLFHFTSSALRAWTPTCVRSDRLLHEPARSSPCIEGDCVIFSYCVSSARHSFSSWPALSLVAASPTSPFLRRRLLLRPYRLLQRRFRRFAVSPRTHGARTVTVVCYFCCAGGAPSVTVLRALFEPAPLSPPFRGFLLPAHLHPLRGRGLSCRGPRRCFALAWPPCRPCAAVIIHTRGFYPTPSSRVWACDSTSLWGGTQGKLESSGCCLDIRFLSRRFLFLPSSLSSRYCWLFSGDESLPSPSF